MTLLRSLLDRGKIVSLSIEHYFPLSIVVEDFDYLHDDDRCLKSLDLNSRPRRLELPSLKATVLSIIAVKFLELESLGLYFSSSFDVGSIDEHQGPILSKLRKLDVGFSPLLQKDAVMFAKYVYTLVDDACNILTPKFADVYDVTHHYRDILSNWQSFCYQLAVLRRTTPH